DGIRDRNVTGVQTCALPIFYTCLSEDGVRVERIHEACSAAGADNTIVLPETSFRDPSGIIPAVANAIRQRLFDSEAITNAIQDRSEERRVGKKRRRTGGRSA